MRATMSKTPTEVKMNLFFSSFKNSKRVQWATYRNYR